MKDEKPSFTGRRRRQTDLSDKVIGIMTIIREIEQGRYPSVQKLADELELSRRTILRYIRAIEAVVPLVYDRKKGGYTLLNREAVKLIPLRHEELAVLVVLYDMAFHMGGPVNRYFQGILKRLQACSAPAVRDFSEIASSFHIIMPGGSEHSDESLFRDIVEGIINHRRLFIQYHGITTRERTKRKVDPYALVLHDGFLYLYAYCHKRKAFRWFGLDRIESLVVLEEEFDRKEDFNIEEELKNSWQMWQGGKVMDVTLRFSNEVAPRILRRPFWHPSEERRELSDGSVELRLKVDGTEEIKQWIYSYLPHVEVIEPPGLRSEIVKELRKALHSHDSMTRPADSFRRPGEMDNERIPRGLASGIKSRNFRL